MIDARGGEQGRELDHSVAEPRLLLLDRERSREVSLRDIDVKQMDESQLLWFQTGTAAQLDQARAAVGLGPVDHRSAEEIEDHVDYVDLVLYAAPEADLLSDPPQIRCSVSEKWVITALSAEDAGAEVVRRFSEHIVESSAAAGRFTGMLFAAELFDWVVQSYADLFADLEAQLEELDARLLTSGGGGREISRLAFFKRRISVIRRALARHREALLVLKRPELQAINTEKSAEWFTEAFERYETVIAQGRDIRDSVRGSFEILSTKSADRMNRKMTLLTVASVLLLPGSVIAGVMGMNFRVGLFRIDWLFWIVILLILGLAGATLLILHLTHWLDDSERPDDS